MKKLLTVTTLSLSLLLSGVGLAVPQHASAATVTSTAKANQIVSTAKSYIGKVKYSFGVNNPNKLILDCSAFTKMVFQQNGITLPWGSKAQAKLGTKITSKSNLKVGDLVMFSVGTPGRIDHVGIYVGNNQFISNTKSKGVVINSMTSGYWSTRFIEGHRL